MRCRSWRFRRWDGRLRGAFIAGLLFVSCGPGGRVDPDAASPRVPSPPPAPAALVPEATADWGGLTVRVVEAKRIAGVLSVQLLFANTSSQPFEFGDRFASDPADRDTLADTVLVEPSGLRKYFVLRDRASHVVGSGAVAPLRPGERRLIAVHFPAPGSGTRITIQIPHVPVFRDVPIS